MDDTCATVHVRHEATNRNTRALITRGHARPRVHLDGRRITHLCARRSLCYSTCARSLQVGTPAHVCAVYGRPVRNFRVHDGRYNTSTASHGDKVVLCKRMAMSSPNDSGGKG